MEDGSGVAALPWSKRKSSILSSRAAFALPPPAPPPVLRALAREKPGNDLTPETEQSAPRHAAQDC